MNALKELGEFKRVILVTGSPGVGKTVVSRLLASRLSGLRIGLAEIVKQEGLINSR